MHARAQVTDVTVSVPNLSGTRVCNGRKYSRAPATRMSVALLMDETLMRTD